jgi:hypothetical protein
VTAQPDLVDFDCTKVGRKVAVIVWTSTLHANPLRDDAQTQMKECSGVHLCKLFSDPPRPASFALRSSVGCPCHESLVSKSIRVHEQPGGRRVIAGRNHLEAEQRRALTMLADAGLNGFAESVIPKLLLADLLRDGFANTRPRPCR